MPTGNAYLDALGGSVGGYAAVLQQADIARDFLVFALMADVGIVIYEPGETVPANRVRYVNSALLALLHYPDIPTYAAAVSAPGFVHADDLVIVEDHIRHNSTTLYEARYLRGDNAQYRRCRTQGMGFAATSTVLRVTMVSAAP